MSGLSGRDTFDGKGDLGGGASTSCRCRRHGTTVLECALSARQAGGRAQRRRRFPFGLGRRQSGVALCLPPQKDLADPERFGVRREAQRHAALGRDDRPAKSGVAAALCHRSPKRHRLHGDACLGGSFVNPACSRGPACDSLGSLWTTICLRCRMRRRRWCRRCLLPNLRAAAGFG